MPENAIHAVLQSAIRREVDARRLYTLAAEMSRAPHARQLLNELAAQEEVHRARLEALLAGELTPALERAGQRAVEDLKITDYLVDVPLQPDSDLQDILIVAGKREKASHELYAALAQVAEDEAARGLFTWLAEEELGHKHHIDALYEEIAYREN